MAFTRAVNATGAYDPATDFISLDRMRREFRVPQNADGSFETDEDTLIAEVTASAVSYAAHHLNIPVLGQTALWSSVNATRRNLTIPVSGMTAVVIDDPFVRQVTSVRYRSMPGVETTALVAGTDYRVEQPSDSEPVVSGHARVYPLDSWPSNAELIVAYSRGIETNYPDLDAIRSIVVLRARSDIDGINVLPDEERTAFERLSSRLRLPASLPNNARLV